MNRDNLDIIFQSLVLFLKCMHRNSRLQRLEYLQLMGNRAYKARLETNLPGFVHWKKPIIKKQQPLWRSTLSCVRATEITSLSVLFGCVVLPTSADRYLAVLWPVARSGSGSLFLSSVQTGLSFSASVQSLYVIF